MCDRRRRRRAEFGLSACPGRKAGGAARFPGDRRWRNGQNDRDAKSQRIATADGAVRAKWVVIATNTPFNNRVVMHTKQAAYRTYVVGLRVSRIALRRAGQRVARSRFQRVERCHHRAGGGSRDEDNGWAQAGRTSWPAMSGRPVKPCRPEKGVLIASARIASRRSSAGA